MNLVSCFRKLDVWSVTVGGWMQPVLLLAIRGWWGWSFFMTGQGKLRNLDRTAEFFASLDLPLPSINAAMAGAVECAGGLLLLLGLGSRLASVPLVFTMAVAYATAHREELGALLGNPDAFTGAAPFPFLLASLIVLAFGPGRLSLDALLWKRGEGG
jgi:putative oxidoreductase